jgi:hypothetical protein
MNRISLFAVPACILVLSGCGSVKVETVAQVPPDQIATGKQYFLRVQTGEPQLDQFLYEFSFHEVGKFLNLVEKQEDADGTVDVLFTTVGHDKIVNKGSSLGSAGGWYTGAGSVAAAAIGSSYSTAEAKTKQWSTMVVAIKTKEGKRLWWADMDLTGKKSVKTPTESARYLSKKLASIMVDSKFQPLHK